MLIAYWWLIGDWVVLQNPYALKYAYVLTNLCEMGVDQQQIMLAMVELCATMTSSIDVY